FQAEDGIRDPLVTGVQTCALPIYRRSGHRTRLGRPPRRLGPEAREERVAGHPPRRRASCRLATPPQRAGTPRGEDPASSLEQARSEERRVGKEWRSG